MENRLVPFILHLPCCNAYWLLGGFIGWHDTIYLGPISLKSHLSRYGYSHYNDNTTAGPSNLYDGNPHTGKMVLFYSRVPWYEFINSSFVSYIIVSIEFFIFYTLASAYEILIIIALQYVNGKIFFYVLVSSPGIILDAL